MNHPRLQRALAHGPRTLPRLCIVDVGGIGRWIYEAATPNAATASLKTWTMITQALRRAPRQFVWVAGLPGRVSDVFGSTELSGSIQSLKQLGITTIVPSNEGLTSLLANQSSVELHEPTAVITAAVDDCPEQLYVLEGPIQAVLDLKTGLVHTYATQHRENIRPPTVLGLGHQEEPPSVEPVLIPLIQAAIVPDPLDAKKKRPPAGRAASRYVRELDAAMQGSSYDGHATTAVPEYVLDCLGKNLARVTERAEELVGRSNGGDVVARANLQRALPGSRSPVGLTTTPPMVIVAFETGNNGTLRLSDVLPLVLDGGVRLAVSNEASLRDVLAELSKNNARMWVAPRALDLLGYMADHAIPLPERIVDPALCAFALNPDSIATEYAACSSAAGLHKDAHRWLWDVERKTVPPPDLDGIATALPRIASELRSKTAARGLDPLIDDDLAVTLPALAAIERRGAWVCGDVSRAQAQIQSAMSSLEQAFLPLVGDVDPYTATPDALLRAIGRRGIALPSAYAIPGNDAKNVLERIAHLDRNVRALLEARTLVEILKWLNWVDAAGGRLRGFHIPQTTGRWGMNRWPLQNIPKRSQWACELRDLLGPPPGKTLVAADFSSFELRLVAGLSRDRRLLAAAQQADAIGDLADTYFGTPRTSSTRAAMKSHIHPINYGVEKRGFVREQISVPVVEAEGYYEQLQWDLRQMFAWRSQILASLASNSFVTTPGGWQRVPGKRRRRSLENAAVSTIVQGLAADILRWCLRELRRTLPAMNADVVFQNHDEIYVATNDEEVAHVTSELRDVFERRVYQSGLVPPNIRLVATTKTSRTWNF